MADDRNARDKQADDAERRQRKREVEEARERSDEVEPVPDEPGEGLGELDDALEDHDYPATAGELIDDYGDYEVETRRGSKSLEEVFASIDDETFDAADDVRSRVQELIHR